MKKDMELRINLKKDANLSKEIEEKYLNEIIFTEKKLSQRTIFRSSAQAIDMLAKKKNQQ